MRGKSRVVPSPSHPKVGDLVGGDVFGSSSHDDGKTITTGDVLEVRPGAVVTKSNKNVGGTETYELGAWLWDDPAARKSLGDPLVARVFEERDDAEIVLGVGQSVVVKFKGPDGSVEVAFKDAGLRDGKPIAPEILVTVKPSTNCVEPVVNVVREALS